MAGFLRYRCVRRAGLCALLALLASTASSCGDDGGGASSKPGPDAASDATLDGAKTGDAKPASDGSSDALPADGGAGDASDASGPITAQDATYTIELGGQIDALLAAPYAGNPALGYALVAQPSTGEILHFDAKSGRFVYTSTTTGTESFDFQISENGQVVDSATITVTTTALDFVGDWQLNPAGSCNDYAFKVSKTDAGTLVISPLVSSCIKQASGMSSIPLGNTTFNEEAQALGAISCVNDIAGVSYCYAFRYWRISSRDDFQSIETVSGTKMMGGQPYLISGQVKGLARRAGDTAQRAAVAGLNTPIVQLGLSDGTPKTQGVTLENKGTLPATLGKIELPSQATMPGGYPGTNGTCGASLDPGKSCVVMLSVTPTAPASGDSESVPLSVYFSDAQGYDVSRLRINWLWKTSDGGSDAGDAGAGD